MSKLPNGYCVTATRERLAGGGFWFCGTVWKDGGYRAKTPAAYELRSQALEQGQINRLVNLLIG